MSPSAQQTKTFSNDRLADPIDRSELLRSFVGSRQNIFEKQFANGSSITLRYAFLNADRARGVSVWALRLDEVQDLLRANIPVLESCTDHAPPAQKFFIYSGTPKSLDNTIEEYRGNSTQGEWVVPCDHCGTPSTGRHWNILCEKNIGKKGPICERCGKDIHPRGPDAQWAFMVEPSAKV